METNTATLINNLSLVDDVALQARKQVMGFQKQYSEMINSYINNIRMIFHSPAFKLVEQVQKSNQMMLKNVLEPMQMNHLLDSVIPLISKPDLSYLANQRNDRLSLRQEYQIQLLEEVVERQRMYPEPYSYHYYSETKTFILHKYIPTSINFSVRSEKDDITILFESFYELLEELGEIQGKYTVVHAKAEDLIRKSKEKGVDSPSRDWLKRTKYNLVKKIPESMENDVVISKFTDGGYYFKIRSRKKLVN